MGNGICNGACSVSPTDTVLMVTRNSSIYASCKERCGFLFCPLSYSEVDLIKKSWPQVKENWLPICLIAFEKWFGTYPELHTLFKSFPSDVTFEELKCHKSLHIHVNKMEALLDILLSQFEQEKRFVQILIEHGKRHADLGVESKYATSLARNLQFAICTCTTISAEVEYAWDTLLRYIMDLLKLGIRLGKGIELEERKKEPNFLNDDADIT